MTVLQSLFRHFSLPCRRHNVWRGRKTWKQNNAICSIITVYGFVIRIIFINTIKIHNTTVDFCWSHVGWQPVIHSGSIPRRTEASVYSPPALKIFVQRQKQYFPPIRWNRKFRSHASHVIFPESVSTFIHHFQIQVVHPSSQEHLEGIPSDLPQTSTWIQTRVNGEHDISRHLSLRRPARVRRQATPPRRQFQFKDFSFLPHKLKMCRDKFCRRFADCTHHPSARTSSYSSLKTF